MKEVAKKAVHKHERAMHPGKPLTKMAHGGKIHKPAAHKKGKGK
jgi:hypothetical protein